MGTALKDIMSKAQVVTLDRPRKLMLTNHAWSHLEEVYGSMGGALRGFAELMTGHKALTHSIAWLWALMQEEVRQANKQVRPDQQETLTREDVEFMVIPADILEYKSRIAETITAFYPTPDPQKPALKEEIPGTGGGYTNSSGASTSGAGMSS